MTLITNTTPHKIEADTGKHIRGVGDIYVPEHINQETGELIPEHFPYYSTVIYVPDAFTTQMMNDLYVEEEIVSE